MYPTKKLSEICDIQNGYAFKSDDYTEKGARLIRITNVQSGYIGDDNPKFLPLSYTNNYDDFSIQENDILISLTGNVGRVGVFPKDLLPALLNQRVGRFTKINNAIINEKYLFLYLNSNFFVTEVINYAEGAAQKNTSTKKIKDIEIPLPPLSTQSKIVAKLDEAFGNIDHQISLLKANIEDVERMKFGVVEQIFEEGNFEIKTLKDVCERIMDGTHFSPKNSDTGDRLYVSAKNIKLHGVDLTKATYISQADHEIIYKRCPVKKGDVLYIKDGATTGVATINQLDEEFSLLSSVAVFQVKKSILSERFLNYYLNSSFGKKHMISMMGGAAITRLTLTKLNSGLIPLPPLPRQHEIIEHLDRVFARTAELCSSYEAQIRDLETLRQSLLEEAFSGRLVSE